MSPGEGLLAGLAAVDELFETRFAEDLAPGLVYGVVVGGRLIHARGLGRTRLAADPGAEVATPGVDSVFRIASMSKSFTAAALLLLRDRGLVELDAPIGRYVPELVDQPPYADDSPPLTLRLLLTMAGGLLSDNPWGDRQESLGHAAFGTFLDGGFTVGAEPGVGFEYANLGYAIIGRAIANVVRPEDPDGADRDFVEAELLAPLGMTATRYDAAAVGSVLVPGHVKRSSGWQELAPVGPGAFSAMGGLHSSVKDLARWVGGLVAAFATDLSARSEPHPLGRATRRELQQLYRLDSVAGTLEVAGRRHPGIGAVATGYGFGLMVDHDTRLGQIVHHSGGYPGYGSRMVWHPASGIGVITLSNGSYGGAYEQSMSAVRLLAGTESSAVPGRVAPPPGRGDRLERALGTAIERLRGFDLDGDEVFADPDLFADNVELDVPDAERRVQLGELRELVGLPLAAQSDVPDRPLRYVSTMRASALVSWPAERGRYEVTVLLSPEEEPRLQSLKAVAVPPASDALVAAARAALLATPEAAVARAF
ncbi:MAG: serine hydrolase domain-containing protein, partial [Nocardioides sp.]|uniref:serine hydrolase domain-containing protein n=1 Tax=Nocardioides sp. TaxID=35761 RepID=UPI0039E3C06E